MTKEEFYEKVSEIARTDFTYIVPVSRITRWNNRKAGNGRIPGCGIVRMYGENLIHVSLTSPTQVNRTFNSVSEVLGFLEQIFKDKRA